MEEHARGQCSSGSTAEAPKSSSIKAATDLLPLLAAVCNTNNTQVLVHVQVKSGVT